MRISDWSSDVCSSDLHAVAAREGEVTDVDEVRVAHVEHVPKRASAGLLRQQPEEGGEVVRFDLRAAVELPDQRPQPVAEFDDAADEKIGRASCRERVCQYV